MIEASKRLSDQKDLLKASALRRYRNLREIALRWSYSGIFFWDNSLVGFYINYCREYKRETVDMPCLDSISIGGMNYFHFVVLVTEESAVFNFASHHLFKNLVYPT